MNVLLVFNSGSNKDMKVLVKLHTKALQSRVNSLLKEKKDRDAFNLIFAKAEVEKYIPPGVKYRMKPELTLIEDML